MTASVTYGRAARATPKAPRAASYTTTWDTAKRADRIKIVWWDGSGICLFAKRLEKSSFCWPRIGHVRVQLNHAQLTALLDGLDWKRVRPVSVKAPVFAG